MATAIAAPMSERKSVRKNPKAKPLPDDLSLRRNTLMHQ